MKQKGRFRSRASGIKIGHLRTGKLNAITDIEGVRVGHQTVIRGEIIRTGVTAVLPHGENLYQEKVPAAVSIGNGFGKLTGYTQVEELGVLESPLVLTNTLNVGTAVQAVNAYTLDQPGNERVRSVNALVGETNDGYLNDIRGMHLREEDVLEAIQTASRGPVREGCVGAGTGTVCMGFKGGMGTASRVLPGSEGEWKIGVLVQTNFGGSLRINGIPVGEMLEDGFSSPAALDEEEGSCMVLLATNAPLKSRDLKRLAKRALFGLVRSGSLMNHGSGEYAVAFSTAFRGSKLSRDYFHQREQVFAHRLNLLFQAAVESAEEAVINSLFMAETMKGRAGRCVKALPLDRVQQIWEKYQHFDQM